MELSARARTPPLLDWDDLVFRQRHAVAELARIARPDAEGWVRPLSGR
ncbi:MAG: hypothetical protein R3B82_29690 [Sandaracinaceae bacterium]